MRQNYGFCIIKTKSGENIHTALPSNCCQCVGDNYYKDYTVEMYIPKEYLDEKKYDEKNILRLLKVMKFMSFKISYEGLTSLSQYEKNALVSYTKHNNFYKFTLKYSDYINGKHTLAAYQVLRLLYQDYFDGVLEEFYNLKSRMPRLSYFTCLQLAYIKSPRYNATYGWLPLLKVSDVSTDYPTRNHEATKFYYRFIPGKLEVFLKNLKDKLTINVSIMHKDTKVTRVNHNNLPYDKPSHYNINNLIKEETLNEYIKEGNYKAINSLINED